MKFSASWARLTYRRAGRWNLRNSWPTKGEKRRPLNGSAKKPRAR